MPRPIQRLAAGAAAAALLLAAPALAQSASTTSTKPTAARTSAAATANAASAESLPAKPIIAEVEVRGTGDIHLILVPGLACDWTAWESFMERNADRYTMHAVTLAGFGGTEAVSKADVPLQQTSWLDAAAQGLAAHIRTHALERPYVIGHSLGGMVAFTMALEHGELIGGALSIDGMAAYPIRDGSMPPEERLNLVDQMLWPQLRAMTAEGWAAQQKIILDSELKDDAARERYEALMAETSAPVAGRYLAELMRRDLRPRFGDAGAPIYVLAALNDHAAARGFGREPLKAFWLESLAGAKKSQIRFVEDAGHFLMDETPEVVDETVERMTSGRSIATGGAAAQMSERAAPNEDAGGGMGVEAMGAMLAKSIESVEGCLGVDIGQFRSGKAVVIGWFEDKAAAKRWYHHPVHQRMMGQVEGFERREPLADVPDDTPLMVVASITFTDRPEIEGIPMPISQIAIEVYAPLKAGAHINGRLAPKEFAPDLVRGYEP